MVSSISQYGTSLNVWQEYAARQTKSTDSVDGTEETELSTENRPPAPPPGGKPAGPPPSGSSEDVTDSQKDTITSILEEYNASELTEEDAIEIVSSLEDSNLKLDRNVGKVLLENGFDAAKIKELATGETTFPPDSLEMRQAIKNFKSSVENTNSNSNSTYTKLDSLLESKSVSA